MFSRLPPDMRLRLNKGKLNRSDKRMLNLLLRFVYPPLTCSPVRARQTFVFVRPPPSSKTNPMNIQCQLVVATPPAARRISVSAPTPLSPSPLPLPHLR